MEALQDIIDRLQSTTFAVIKLEILVLQAIVIGQKDQFLQSLGAKALASNTTSSSVGSRFPFSVGQRRALIFPKLRKSNPSGSTRHLS